ncbi:MAG TPA: GAF domain-containing protein [Chloroflexia bacterium]|nr:GAF domain-containing protein [Chloroflexia bacterium]
MNVPNSFQSTNEAGFEAFLLNFTSIFSSNNREEILTELLRRTLQLFQADIAGLVLIKEGKSSSINYLNGTLPHDIEFLQEGLTGLAFQTNETVTTSDYLVDTAFKHSEALDEYIRQAGTVASMVTPVKFNDCVVGLLEVARTKPYDWTTVDKKLSSEIAVLVALGVHNSQQMDQLQTQVAQNDLLRKQRDQLANMLRLARETLHEISQPLTVLQMEMELITDLGEVPTPSLLNDLQTAVDKLMETVRGYQRQRRDLLDSEGISVETLEGRF